jgi:PKD repeat protein
MIKATYQTMIRNDAIATNCRLPLVSGVQTAPEPTFPTGTDFGDTAEVAITCSFPVITPFISGVLGNSVSVSASAVFPVRTGQIATNEGPPPVTEPPNPAFSADNTFGGAPLTVTFHDESGSYPTAWFWDFDNDGDVDSTEQDPVFTYNDTGTYSVSLVVANEYGTSDPLVKSDLVTVVPSEGVAFEADQTSGEAPLPVQFTDRSSISTPTAWLWEFGDGATSTSQNPSHAYSAGEYDVTLTVTNASGSQSATIENYISATVASCEVPVLIDVRRNSAQAAWAANDFTTTIADQPSAPGGNYWIKYQSPTGLSVQPCDSPMLVNGTVNQ